MFYKVEGWRVGTTNNNNESGHEAHQTLRYHYLIYPTSSIQYQREDADNVFFHPRDRSKLSFECRLFRNFQLNCWRCGTHLAVSHPKMPARIIPRKALRERYRLQKYHVYIPTPIMALSAVWWCRTLPQAKGAPRDDSAYKLILDRKSLGMCAILCHWDCPLICGCKTRVVRD